MINDQSSLSSSLKCHETYTNLCDAMLLKIKGHEEWHKQTARHSEGFPYSPKLFYNIALAPKVKIVFFHQITLYTMRDKALRKSCRTFLTFVTLPINHSVLCRPGHKQWIHERIKVHRANKICFTNCGAKFSLVFYNYLFYLFYAFSEF